MAAQNKDGELKTVDSVPDLKNYVSQKKNVKVVVLLGASVSSLIRIRCIHGFW